MRRTSSDRRLRARVRMLERQMAELIGDLYVEYAGPRLTLDNVSAAYGVLRSKAVRFCVLYVAPDAEQQANAIVVELGARGIQAVEVDPDLPKQGWELTPPRV